MLERTGLFLTNQLHDRDLLDKISLILVLYKTPLTV
jgi:hypothetical protein